MSTKASIVYSEKSGVHIYHELLDNNVYLGVERDDIEIVVKIMPMAEWLEAGLPNIGATRPRLFVDAVLPSSEANRIGGGTK